MPTTQERMIAMTAISTVRGPRWTIRSTTVSPLQKDVPSFPVPMSFSQVRYCTVSGALNPRSASILARSSGLIFVACVPNMILTGSPGIMRRETKMMTVTPSNAGMACNTLHKTYFDITLPFLHRRTGPGLSPSPPLFLHPPDFVAHAFPEVDAPGGGPMALDVVPPGHRDDGIGPHDPRLIPVQDCDALVDQRFELHRIRRPGRRCHDGVEFRVGVAIEVVAASRLEPGIPVVGNVWDRGAVPVDAEVKVAALRFLPPHPGRDHPNGRLDLQLPLQHVLHNGPPGEKKADIPDQKVQALEAVLIPGLLHQPLGLGEILRRGGPQARLHPHVVERLLPEVEPQPVRRMGIDAGCVQPPDLFGLLLANRVNGEAEVDDM